MSLPKMRNIVSAKEDKHDDYGFRIFTEMGMPLCSDDFWGMKHDLPEMPAWVNDVHNKFTGRCYLFGTGPSLTGQLPLLGALKEAKTFTCNRMAKWKDLPFTPWLHCVTEPAPFIRWGVGVLPQYDYPAAQNRVACIWYRVSAPGWLWLPKAPDDVQVRWQSYWGTQPELPPVPTAWASPLTIGQLALWMGFTELFLLGCDTTQTGQAWDPVYGRTQQKRNIRSIIECAERAYRDVTRAGRILRDCTPGGRLNVEGAIPYVSLQEVLPI